MGVESSGIVVTHDEVGVAHILIDRAEVGNSLSPPLARDFLTELFVRLPATLRYARCCYPRRGRGTSVRARDLRRPTRNRVPTPTRSAGRATSHGCCGGGWQALVTSVLECDKPVIATVKGVAAGAGSSLMLACDLVVMSTQATLVESFVHRGILPDSGAAYLLTRIVGATQGHRVADAGRDARCCGV